MNRLVPTQAGAQLISLTVYIAVAVWYVVPWLTRRERSAALIAPLWLHVFRYVALQIFSAQQQGFPISTGGAIEIAIGDIGGAVIAFVAIVLLRRRTSAGVTLAWLLVIETAIDTILNVRGGIDEHLMGAASGVVWMILVFYVPAIVVSVGLLAWQLLARRHEAIAPAQATQVAGGRLQEQS